MNRISIWFGVMIVTIAILAAGSVGQASAAEQVTVIGVLEEIKRKIYLSTDKEKFMVVGQDFSRLVGRKVKATGKVIENYRGKSLMVTVVEIVRD